jgi:hypothetical protein
VVGSASVAFPLNPVHHQRGSIGVTARQERLAANLNPKAYGPYGSPQWSCHGLALLHWVAFLNWQNLQDIRSHLTASKQRQRQIVIKENHREGEGGNTFPIWHVPIVNPGEQRARGAAYQFLWLTLLTHGWMGDLPTCEENNLHLSLKECSGDILLGWEAVEFYPPSPSYRELCYTILTSLNLLRHFDIPEPSLVAYSGAHPDWVSRRVSVDRTICLMGQPRISTPEHRNSPIRFLEPFCHLEENSIPLYLFKECSRPYLIAINRSSQDITGSVFNWECSL